MSVRILVQVVRTSVQADTVCKEPPAKQPSSRRTASLASSDVQCTFEMPTGALEKLIKYTFATRTQLSRHSLKLVAEAFVSESYLHNLHVRSQCSHFTSSR
jgi:hypothetical protein